MKRIALTLASLLSLPVLAQVDTVGNDMRDAKSSLKSIQYDTNHAAKNAASDVSAEGSKTKSEAKALGSNLETTGSHAKHDMKAAGSEVKADGETAEKNMSAHGHKMHKMKSTKSMSETKTTTESK